MGAAHRTRTGAPPRRGEPMRHSQRERCECGASAVRVRFSSNHQGKVVGTVIPAPHGIAVRPRRGRCQTAGTKGVDQPSLAMAVRFLPWKPRFPLPESRPSRGRSVRTFRCPLRKRRSPSTTPQPWHPACSAVDTNHPVSPIWLLRVVLCRTFPLLARTSPGYSRVGTAGPGLSLERCFGPKRWAWTREYPQWHAHENGDLGCGW